MVKLKLVKAFIIYISRFWKSIVLNPDFIQLICSKLYSSLFVLHSLLVTSLVFYFQVCYFYCYLYNNIGIQKSYLRAKITFSSWKFVFDTRIFRSISLTLHVLMFPQPGATNSDYYPLLRMPIMWTLLPATIHCHASCYSFLLPTLNTFFHRKSSTHSVPLKPRCCVSHFQLLLSRHFTHFAFPYYDAFSFSLLLLLSSM